MSKSTSGTIFVRLPKRSSLLFLPSEEALLQFESTCSTCETVALIVGRSKKTPAPASPCPSNTEIPKRSSGVKAVEMVKVILSIDPWKGIALNVVSGLEAR